ncbi:MULTISPECIES: DNA polymerase Y family protein [unclassified Duganella]|uniref:Y-family DNA polymerase n=1 Tax=unclassified Duganella TaxID=2636909 RepID=UPI000E3498B5|nr:MULTISPECIES: DNA polymerase Y family protein [unclassified Duganella]RFP14735.1 DNA polymerase Y family protein [Duganella sp. BJB475]RFP31084.1 DNA polymerase Y family protein [Duganella sp. BJB476]
MRLWIGLHLPRLPLEVFCPRWSDDGCTVVLEQERVVAMSALARQAGIDVGMRRGGALMLAPQSQFQQRAPQREVDAQQAVALALLQFTPQLAQAEEATLLLDVGASLRLFGGIRALCRQVAASMETLGFTATLSCAPTARGAWLLARSNAGRALTMDALVRRMDRLPSSLLPPARPYLSWLEGIGCLTLGEMRRLPRPGLQRRCGRALLDMLDDAYGERAEMHRWLEAPASFRAKLELFDRVENAEALLFGARRLLQQLTGWLSARQFAVERIRLLLEHERGKVAGPPTVIDIVLAEPTWRDEHLVRLLKERLAKQALDAPVIGLCLEAPQVQAMAPPSDTLFPEPGGSKEDWQRLLELLTARLGPDNVLQAAPRADYRPEQANAWVSVQEKIRPADARAQLPPDMPGLPRPAWLLAKPIPLLMRDHRPFYGSPLKIMSTGERIEAGWWGAMQTRDYFMAEGEDFAHYWLYRERTGHEGEQSARWYLHGLFG